MSSLDLRRRYNVFIIAPPEVFYEYRRYSPMYRKHGFGHMSKYFPVFYRAHENGDYVQIHFWVCPDIFGHMSKSVKGIWTYVQIRVTRSGHMSKSVEAGPGRAGLGISI